MLPAGVQSNIVLGWTTHRPEWIWDKRRQYCESKHTIGQQQYCCDRSEQSNIAFQYCSCQEEATWRAKKRYCKNVHTWELNPALLHKYSSTLTTEPTVPWEIKVLLSYEARLEHQPRQIPILSTRLVRRPIQHQYCECSQYISRNSDNIAYPAGSAILPNIGCSISCYIFDCELWPGIA